MDAAECRAFESNAGFDDAVRLRGWDDGGKVEGLDVGRFDDYVPLLSALVS
jgi:predicted HD phosphohydrolase